MSMKTLPFLSRYVSHHRVAASYLSIDMGITRLVTVLHINEVELVFVFRTHLPCVFVL